MTRGEIVEFLDKIFPAALALDWDHSGLQVGPLSEPCRKVLVALDFELSLIPHLRGIDLLITHHPLFFRPINTIRTETPVGQKLKALLTEGTACYAIHTPYDVAHGGLGEVLAEVLELKNPRPLSPWGRLLKLVVFVPKDHVEVVTDAIFAAGAGKIGGYGRCSFRTRGTGTFLPEPGAQPYIGEVGREEQVDEVRLETVVPAEMVQQVVAAMLSAHPYEEVAYDVYPLENKFQLHGLGRVGDLAQPAPAQEVANQLMRALGVSTPKATFGDLNRLVSRAAVCGGSGGDLWPQALSSGAQLYLTGEANYHQGLDAAESGLTLVALGHRETERLFVSHVATLIRKQFPKLTVVEA